MSITLDTAKHMPEDPTMVEKLTDEIGYDSSTTLQIPPTHFQDSTKPSHRPIVPSVPIVPELPTHGKKDTDMHEYPTTFDRLDIVTSASRCQEQDSNMSTLYTNRDTSQLGEKKLIMHNEMHDGLTGSIVEPIPFIADSDSSSTEQPSNNDILSNTIPEDDSEAPGEGVSHDTTVISAVPFNLSRGTTPKQTFIGSLLRGLKKSKLSPTLTINEYAKKCVNKHPFKKHPDDKELQKVTTFYTSEYENKHPFTLMIAPEPKYPIPTDDSPADMLNPFPFLHAMHSIDLDDIEPSVFSKSFPKISDAVTTLDLNVMTVLNSLKEDDYSMFRILLACPSIVKYMFINGKVQEKNLIPYVQEVIEELFSTYSHNAYMYQLSNASKQDVTEDAPKIKEHKTLGFTYEGADSFRYLDSDKASYHIMQRIAKCIDKRHDDKTFARKVKTLYLIHTLKDTPLNVIESMVSHNITAKDKVALVTESNKFAKRGCLMMPCELYNNDGKKDIRNKPANILDAMTKHPAFKDEHNAYLLSTCKNNGFMVLDLDAAKTTANGDILSGQDLWASILKHFGMKEPKTYQVKSGYGRHLYFKYDERLDTCVGKWWKGKRYAMDILIDNHVIGPGSFHPVAKKVYIPFDDNLPILPFPEELVKIFQQTVISSDFTPSKSQIYNSSSDVTLFWNSTYVACNILDILVKNASYNFEEYRSWADLAQCLKICEVPFERFLAASRDSFPNFVSEDDCKLVWNQRVSPNRAKKMGIKWLYGMMKGMCGKALAAIKADPKERGKIRLHKYPAKKLWSDHELLHESARYNNLHNSDPARVMLTVKTFRDHIYRIIDGKETSYIMYEQPTARARLDSNTNYTFVTFSKQEMKDKFSFARWEHPADTPKGCKSGPLFTEDWDYQEVSAIISHPGHPEFYVDNKTGKKYINVFEKPYWTASRLREWVTTEADQAKLNRVRDWLFWHIVKVICDVPNLDKMGLDRCNPQAFTCDDPDFIWLYNWVGNTLFNYIFRPDVAPSVYGPQGCGKTTWFNIGASACLEKCYTAFTKELKRIEDNGIAAQLIDKLLIQVDDANVADAELVMNNRITSRTVSNKLMNKDVFETDNWAKWFFTTNNMDHLPRANGTGDKRRYAIFKCNATHIPSTPDAKQAYFDKLHSNELLDNGKQDPHFGLYIAACFLDYDPDFKAGTHRPRGNKEEAKMINDPVLTFMKDHLLPNWSSLMYKGTSGCQNLVPVDLLYNEYKAWFELNKSRNEFTGNLLDKKKFKEEITNTKHASVLSTGTKMGRARISDHEKNHVTHPKAVPFSFNDRKLVAANVLGKFSLATEEGYIMCPCNNGAGIYKKDGTESLYCARCAMSEGIDSDESNIDTEQAPMYIRTIENIHWEAHSDAISIGLRPLQVQ